ncbi:MAG: sigma-70 family RNA polymerase sigma factor [Planctomycetota bacterium]
MPDDSMPPHDASQAALSFNDLPAPAVSLALLAKAQAGDREALHDLLTRYQDRLHRIVSIQLGGSKLRRMHDSLDVVQDTFLAALPKIAELRPRSPSSLLRWLAMIALHQVRDAYDHQHAQKRDMDRVLQDGGSVSGQRRFDGIASTGNGPAEEAELAELRALLDNEVARLPEDKRRVVLLRDYCGEAWEHIAEELHRDQGAARQLHQRAWIRLRGQLRSVLEDRRTD